MRSSVQPAVLVIGLWALLPGQEKPAPAPDHATSDQVRHTADQVRTGRFGELNPLPNPFTVVDWNIDRGEEREAITKVIRDLSPDVCVLQEVDLMTRRTGFRDVATDLAHDLGFSFAFGTAFEELNQGTREKPAWQGQATLSRAEIASARVLRFARQSGFWAPRPYLPSWFPQRRLGGRIALVTEVGSGNTRVFFYNVHLESREPTSTRFSQLEETLADAKHVPPNVPVVIAGDLNTKFFPNEFVHALEREGFRSCFGEEHRRSHRVAGYLDWIFVRGPVSCEDPVVHYEARGSDHYPLSARIRLRQ